MHITKEEHNKLVKVIQICLMIFFMASLFFEMHVVYGEELDTDTIQENTEVSTEESTDIDIIKNEVLEIHEQIETLVNDYIENQEMIESLEILDNRLTALETKIQEQEAVEEMPANVELDTETRFQYMIVLMPILATVLYIAFRRK